MCIESKAAGSSISGSLTVSTAPSYGDLITGVATGSEKISLGELVAGTEYRMSYTLDVTVSKVSGVNYIGHRYSLLGFMQDSSGSATALTLEPGSNTVEFTSTGVSSAGFTAYFQSSSKSSYSVAYSLSVDSIEPVSGGGGDGGDSGDNGDWHTLPDVVYHVKNSGSYTFEKNDIVSPISYASGFGSTTIPDINPGSTYTLEFVHSNTVSKSVGIPTVTLGFLSYTNDVSGTNFSKSYKSLGGSTEQVTFTAQDGIVLFTSANSSSLVASDFGVGECAWSYDVTHTISNIRYKRVMDQDTLDKIEDNTGRGADAAEETAETTKGIWETIKEFFGGFFNNLIESIIHLFVPTSEEMSGLFDELNQFFSDTFGFLYAPFDYLIQLIGVFTSSSGSTGLVFPGFSIMGHEVWPDMTYDISSDPVAGKVLEYVRIGTGVLLAGWFIMYLQDFFKEKFGSGGG